MFCFEINKCNKKYIWPFCAKKPYLITFKKKSFLKENSSHGMKIVLRKEKQLTKIIQIKITQPPNLEFLNPDEK